ncbi:PilZ domain-containing protein [Sedimentibacter sp. zth1]|uniref:PilZ domain-containing protein n=1 Tax=Sedimentibacter sp. zth1 TaxID=2816908 RepID=UPI001A91A4DB|nr:PilZ domain-containing protein [Sedimentibacter sp. zth1]QSX07175.1 PilZ domain-containing protein [Sedimentibacter sp. zth1]
MIDNSLLVKIFDRNKQYLGKGKLDKIVGSRIVIKGNNLPIIHSKETIFLNVFNELRGVLIYECIVNIGANMQLTATILKQHGTIERRRTLKIRTAYTTSIRLVIRDNKALSIKDPIVIKMLNLSIGGMLFTSKETFCINDIITFTFDHYQNCSIDLEAKIIRVDKTIDEYNNDNYGCIFIGVTPYDENVICKYLYERQLQIYKKK